MNKLERRKLLHLATSYLLEARGYSKRDDVYDIEWDAKEPDSQFSLCYEDVEAVLDGLEKHGYEIFKTREPAPTPESPSEREREREREQTYQYVGPNVRVTGTSFLLK